MAMVSQVGGAAWSRCTPTGSAQTRLRLAYGVIWVCPGDKALYLCDEHDLHSQHNLPAETACKQSLSRTLWHISVSWYLAAALRLVVSWLQLAGHRVNDDAEGMSGM